MYFLSLSHYIWFLMYLPNWEDNSRYDAPLAAARPQYMSRREYFDASMSSSVDRKAESYDFRAAK